jgi:pSer/pThr/pTyr-binding forkhead associated (FHA) protein
VLDKNTGGFKKALRMNDALDRRELAIKALAGLIGGAVGWVPVELATHGHSLTEAQSTSTVIAGIVSVALVAGMIGGMVLAAEGNSLEITPTAVRRFCLGFIVCLVLAIPETYYSDLIFSKILYAGGWRLDHAGSELYLIAGRLIGWTLMGLMLGVGVGLASASLRNAVKGALGGTIGGFVGGAAFDIIGSFSQSGLASRLIGFCVIGLLIGFFIGLVQQLTKSAWLVVEAGRLRGRQFRLDAPLVTVGRAEENAVGLFGDPGVQPRHAVITRNGENYMVKNIAVQSGTLVNGGRIESVALKEGDRIQVGGYELAFHVRAERQSRDSAIRATPARAAPSIPAVPQAIASANSTVSPAATATPRLVAVNGEQFGVAAARVTRLGRALDNDIVIDDASVSRHHASIECRNGGFVVRDLGSRNGTWIEGQRITEAMLGFGNSLRFGDAVFTFHG